MQVRNTAKGPRGINIVKNGVPQALMLDPGETSGDITLADANDPVFLGFISMRELEVVSSSSSSEPTPATTEPQTPPPPPAASDAPTPESKKKG